MKVFLIGAGPGDPGLLTLKGKKALEVADVVIYDYLASPALLGMARKDAEKIYVGKKAGSHALPQDGINALLVEKAREGKTVARLKGGDPYIFGRGGEEALALVEAGIPFEEVPGVSSTVAGPAYAGIPLTHRSFSSSVTIITGHENADKSSSVHNWDALAKSASTLVFVMGMKHLPEICANLVSAGLSPETPGALIHWATTPSHRSVTASLTELPQRAIQGGFTNPSLIVIGEVVRLHDALNWFEHKELLGKGIVVTRAREQASGLATALEELGARVFEYPTITIRKHADSGSLSASLAVLPQYDCIVFTSVNGVDCFFEGLFLSGRDTRALAGARVAAIGSATADALAVKGIRADIVPDEFKAEAVAEALIREGVRGDRILLARARVARDVLPEMLREAGAVVDVVPVYETLPVEQGRDDVLKALEEGHIQCITFGSSSTVDNFFASVPPDVVRDVRARHPLVFACIGPITGQALGKYGFECGIMPASYTIPDMVDALREYFNADRPA